MSSINPLDIPGYTQMYTFGVKVIGPGRDEYMVITVRGPTEKMAKAHIWGLFQGNFQNRTVAFYTDLDEWKREAKPDEKESE